MTVRVNKSAFNIREKLSELERPIGVKGNELMRAETLQDARDLVSAGRKNLIINGDFRISQRGNYSSTTTVANNGYYLDRWKIFLKPGLTTGNIQRLTTNQPPNAPSDSYSVRVTATNTASGDLRLSQPFENPNRFRSQTVTLSAWVKTNSPNCRLYYFVGGSYNSDDFSDPVNGDGNWHYVSFTTTMRSDITHFYPIIGMDGDASADVTINNGEYFELAQVQLEFGKNATDFEHRSYGEELALCQRYYQKSYPTEVTPGTNVSASLGFAGMEGRTGMSNVSSTGEHFRGTKLFPSMRTTPNVTVYDRVGNAGKITGTKYLVADTDNVTGPVQNVCATGFQVKCINAGDFGGISFHYTADAEL